MSTKYALENKAAWVAAAAELFSTLKIPSTLRPASCRWESPSAILRALNPFLGRDLNHTMLPQGGGLDMLSAKYAGEILELDAGGTIYQCRPVALDFEFIKESPHDSFLLLTTDNLKATGVNGPATGYEEAVDLGDGTFCSRSTWDQGQLEDGKPIPKTARLIVRFHSGKFLFVSKAGIWNHLPGKADAYLESAPTHHSKLTAQQIRSLITRIVAAKA